MAVPLLDLKAQYNAIREEILDAARRVLDSQQCVLGPEVEALESEIAAYCGCEHAVGVTSGTDALLISLMALEIGPGDEVILPAYTFFATAGSVARAGARPVFADIDPGSFNLDPARLEAAATDRTKAVIPVHLYGQTAEMDAVNEFAKRRGLAVIEDAAQAIGAEYRGRRAGSLGTCGCLSFYPTKNLNASGDAGMVVTNDETLAEKIRVLRVHGMAPKYYHKRIGGNFRLDALQAAILRVKFKYLDPWTEARQRNAELYHEALKDLAEEGKAVLPEVLPERRHVFNQFIIRVAAERRDGLVKRLRENGIGCEIYYPLSLHQQECFADLGGKEGDFPESEKAARETLALPIYPELAPEQITETAASIRACLTLTPEARADDPHRQQAID